MAGEQRYRKGLAKGSCASNQIGESKDVAQDNISYVECEDRADIDIQVRFAGSRGTTLVLSTPGNIMQESKLIAVDSTEKKGAFYYVPQSTENVFGEPHFIFTDIDNKKYDNLYLLDRCRLPALPHGYNASQGWLIAFYSSNMKPGYEVLFSTFEITIPVFILRSV